MDENEKKIILYETLLKKYQKLINENEKKTVGEIKSLINKNDLTIESFVEQFKPEKYEFDKYYLLVLKKCYDFIISEINFVKIGFDLNYWLDAKDILKNKIADDEDISVMMCSIMLYLGDKNAEIVICELENYSTHSIITTEYKSQFIILDPMQKFEFEKFIGEKNQIINKYSFNEKKIKRFIYKFNNEKYEQFL